MKMPMHLYATFDFLSNQLHISAVFCEIIVLARQVKSYELVAIVHRLLLLLVDITQCSAQCQILTSLFELQSPGHFNVAPLQLSS